MKRPAANVARIVSMNAPKISRLKEIRAKHIRGQGPDCEETEWLLNELARANAVVEAARKVRSISKCTYQHVNANDWCVLQDALSALDAEAKP
jgi:hypothetical protein